MDPIDYKILEILKKNAREKASNISKEIHLSVSSVIERIHHMEKEGIIQGYTTLIRTVWGMILLHSSKCVWNIHSTPMILWPSSIRFLM